MAKATQTVNPLHFEDLEPHRFEDLVRQLIYDFRSWSVLEPLGRSGNDDGIDIRGLETVYDPNDLDEEENEEAGFARDSVPQQKSWIIQCKRYAKLGPKEIEKIVENNISSQSEIPYGYMLVASCDFSLTARQKFHKATAQKGVEESYLIGKAELEDMLFRPANDHLLFAYFGISLQVRRRSSRTRLRSEIALKRSLLKHVGGFQENGHKYLLIRDPNNEQYPYLEDIESCQVLPWRFWRFWGHNPHNCIMFVKRQCYAYFDPELKEWDALLYWFSVKWNFQVLL